MIDDNAAQKFYQIRGAALSYEKAVAEATAAKAARDNKSQSVFDLEVKKAKEEFDAIVKKVTDNQ